MRYTPEMRLAPSIQEQVDALQAIPDADISIDGSAVLLVREIHNGEIWELAGSGERQALPSGAVPLKAHGGPAICGMEWFKEEVEAFYAATSDAVIYERRVA
jgi:hypothetical protein